MLTLKSIERSLSLNKPIELYFFEFGSTYYAYTSGTKQHLHTDGIVYQPLALKRSKVQRTSEDYKNKLDIDMPGDSAIPLLFRSHLPSKHVTLKVFRSQRDNPKLFVNVFAGEVSSVTWNNSVATVQCNPASALLRRQILRFGYQAQCNHHLYDDLCGLDITNYQEAQTVTQVEDGGRLVYLSGFNHDADYYLAGLLSFDETDFRMITDIDLAAGSVQLISGIDSLAPGDQVKLAKGCNRSAQACHSFGNFDNFYGCLTIPDENPFA